MKKFHLRSFNMLFPKYIWLLILWLTTTLAYLFYFQIVYFHNFISKYLSEISLCSILTKIMNTMFSASTCFTWFRLYTYLTLTAWTKKRCPAIIGAHKGGGGGGKPRYQFLPYLNRFALQLDKPEARDLYKKIVLF